jgi:RNA polymerase sigma-70 factor (ECF subfamily)
MHVVNAAVVDRWSALTDEDVVRQVIDGHTALFEILMRRHNERLYRAGRAILGDDAEAEDVMQQAYVNAYAHLRQFDRRAKFSTWLTRIAVNEALARRRRRAMHEPIDSEDGLLDERVALMQPAPTPEREAFAHELRSLVESAVDDLPDGCREVFMLRQVEGMNTAETAECLGVSEDVVKTRFSRARALLRRDLAERAGIAAAHSFTFARPRCDRVVAAVLARIG